MSIRPSTWNVAAALIAAASLLCVSTAAAPETPPARKETGKVAVPSLKGSEESGGKAEIRGVVAAALGKGVAGAVVRVVAEVPRTGLWRELPINQPTILKSEVDGAFHAKGLTGATFTVRVEAQGFAPFTAKQIPAGASLRVNLKPGGIVAGRVLDLGTKEPLPKATIYACDPDASAFGRESCPQTTTGEDGRFRISNLAPGIVNLEGSAAAHARRRLERIRVQPRPSGETGELPEVMIFLGPGGRLAGRIVDAEGKPVAGADVRSSSSERSIGAMMRAAASSMPDRVKTEASGRFEVDGLPAGAQYTITAAKPGYASAKAGPFAIDPGTDRSDLEIRLQPAATLKARVVDPDGKPVSGVEFALRPAERRAGSVTTAVASEKVDAGSDGQYTVRELDPGTYSLGMHSTDWADIEREGVRLVAGETTDLGTLTAREGKGIAGRVSDRAGEPISGATIEVYYGDMRKFQSRTSRTKDDGRFRIQGIEDGSTLRAVVTAEGYASSTREGISTGDSAVDFTLEQSGSIVGKVLLSEGQPAIGFRVNTHPEAKESNEGGMFRAVLARPTPDRVFSDPSGSFRLDGIDPGTYTIEVVADGRVPAKKTGVEIASEQVVDLGALVLAEGKTLRGRVLDSKDETPVAGALVRVAAPQGMRFDFSRATADAGTMTGLDGAFTVGGLDVGSWTVAAEHPDFASAEARVEIAADQDPSEVLVRLSRGGTLTGLVRDPQRQPVPGMSIIITKGMFGFDARTAETGPDGRYTFQSTTLDFDEAPKVALSGRVLRGGEPVGSVLLIFMLQGSSSIPSSVQSTQADESGGYSVGLDRGGSYHVMVQSGGIGGFRQSGGADITVPEEAEAHVDILLSTGGISGKLVDADGKAVAQATVTALRDGAAPTDPSGRVMAQSDSSGAYSIDSLGSGTYRLSASAAGYQVAESYPVILSEATPAATVDLRLERGESLRGRVVDTQGRGIAGALVFAAASGAPAGGGVRPAQTDVNGDFVATAPAMGPMDVTAVVSGWAPARATGVVARSDVDGPAVVLRTSFGGRIRVQITGSQGEPASGVQVSASPVPAFPGSDFAGFMNRPQPTGTDGVASISLLAPGVYDVAIPDRSDVPKAQVTVSEGVEATVSFKLP